VIDALVLLKAPQARTLIIQVIDGELVCLNEAHEYVCGCQEFRVQRRCKHVQALGKVRDNREG